MILEEGATHYRALDWDDALDRIAKTLRGTAPERSFFYASGRSSNEAGFLLQLFGRRFGTNHIHNCSFYCHQASGVGLGESIGSSTATVDLSDLDRCDAVVLIGANPASNHPRLMTTLARLRRRGGRVIVVNPLREVGLESFRVPSDPRSLVFGSSISSSYIQPSIGGDIALMCGIAKSLLESDSIDHAFIESHTEGFEELEQVIARTPWSQIVQDSGVAEEEIRAVAHEIASSKRVIFAWTMGITHHLHGVENVQWIVNLALLTGMVGKPGAGLMPIRGHSNVQGMGTVGVTPAISERALEALAELGIGPPAWQGHDTMGSIAASDSGGMDFALCLGGNLFGASPDANFVSRALANVDLIVYLSTTLNTGHVHGVGKTTIVLPVLARDEEPESSTQESMFSYLRLSDGGEPRHTGPRSEASVLAAIADRALPDDRALVWRELGSHESIRQLIAKFVPSLAPIATIGSTKEEFQIAGRTKHTPEFSTPSGLSRFKGHDLPIRTRLKENELRLMTIRSEGQFNTVVYEEEDVYRGQDARDVILLCSDDIDRLGFQSDQRVVVKSSVGEMRNIRVRPFDIAAGCAAMYYPEANVLVPSDFDPRSKTPAFKSVIVTLARDDHSVPEESHVEFHASAKSRSSMKAC